MLISALLILLAGCFGVPPDESPGYTSGTITGIIAAPCCSTSDGPVTATQGVYPEYWCYYCDNTWSLQKGVEVILTYGLDEVATTTTNEDGEYTFTNVPPAKNYVITALCPDYDDERPLVKDVALKVVEGKVFDAKITDCISTALGLVVDYLVENTTVLGPEEIVLDGVIAGIPNFYGFPEFKKLVERICEIAPGCVNLFEDEKVPDYLCRAAQEIGRKVLPDLNLGCAPGYDGGGFTPTVVRHTLTLLSDPVEGALSLIGAGTYDEGTKVAVNTAANPCYTFLNWTVDVGNLGWVTGDLNTEPLEVDMNGNVTLTAHFDCPPISSELDISNESVSICVPDCATIDSVTVNSECEEGDVFPMVLIPPYDSSVLTFGYDDTKISFDYGTGKVCFIGETLPYYATIVVTYTDPCRTQEATGTVEVEFKDCSCPDLNRIDLLPDVTANVCNDDCFTFTEVKLYDLDGTTVLETIALPDPRVELTHSGAVNDVIISDITGGVQVCLKDGNLNTPYTITATYTDPCEVPYTATEVITFELCCPYIYHIDLLPDGPIVLCPDTCFTFTEVKLYDLDGTTVLETIALPDSRVVLTSNDDTNVDINDITGGGVEVCLADNGVPDAYNITATYTDSCDTYTDEECVDFKVCNLPGQLTINSYTNPGPDTHYFEVNVTTSVSGTDVSDGNYLGWCCDLANTGFISGTVSLFCSYWEGQDGQGIWPKINYIINTYEKDDIVYDTDHLGGDTLTMMDIQRAIWLFTNPIDYSTWWWNQVGWPSWRAYAVYNDADVNGVYFCPAIGQVYAAAFPRDIRCPQNLFIEVTRTCHCLPLQQ